MRQLAVVIVSYNSAHWLRACLVSAYAHAGDVQLDVVVVDNGSADGSVDLLEREFPHARVVRAPNRGFAAGNNAGLKVVTAPFVLFLNPDTEILDGTFGELLDTLEERPSAAVLGCRQVTEDGSLYPTIRRFPSTARYLFAALGSEHLPVDASWFGERVRNRAAYERDIRCDWTSGSFMLARREAVVAAGGFDERYFLYSEEPDLCLRLNQRGWEVRHVPTMTILHYAGKAGIDPRLIAQDAYSRRQYLLKNLPGGRARLALLACGLRHLLRAGYFTRDPARGRALRASARQALRTVLGRDPPPFADVLRSGQRNT